MTTDTAGRSRPQVILDTDIGTDVDDAHGPVGAPRQP